SPGAAHGLALQGVHVAAAPQHKPVAKLAQTNTKPALKPVSTTPHRPAHYNHLVPTPVSHEAPATSFLEKIVKPQEEETTVDSAKTTDAVVTIPAATKESESPASMPPA